jgi:hypothetical protein
MEPTVAQYLVLFCDSGPEKMRVSGMPVRKQSISRKRCGGPVGVVAEEERPMRERNVMRKAREL